MFIHRLSIVFAALAALSHASPLPEEPSAAMVLRSDDVIVVGVDNSVRVMKDYEYDQLASSIAPRGDVAAAHDIVRQNHPRDCDESGEIQVLSDETFLNWDTPMSPVASASGGDATVTITDGYSLANSVTVGTGIGVGPIEKILTLNFKVDYTEMWTTTQTQGFLFKVPDGQFGLVVSQPKVRRITGNYLSGCSDNWEKAGFTSDSYTHQTYGDLHWVQGIIRLCNSTSYPVPYCIGTGSHY